MRITSNIIGILFISILIDFLEFTIILPLLPKILTYYGSGTGVSHVRNKKTKTDISFGIYFNTYVGFTLCSNNVICAVHSRFNWSTE